MIYSKNHGQLLNVQKNAHIVIPIVNKVNNWLIWKDGY